MIAKYANNWCVMTLSKSEWVFSPIHIEFFNEFADAYKVFQAWKVLHPTLDVRMYEIHRGMK